MVHQEVTPLAESWSRQRTDREENRESSSARGEMYKKGS